MRAPLWMAWGLLTMALVAPRRAHAETPETVYDRAWTAMDRGEYAVACELFDESYHQSRATGPLQGLASCYEARGLLKQALQLWRVAERDLPPDSLSGVKATAAIARLRPLVPVLVLKGSTTAPSSMRVELDGEMVPLDGTPMAVDPMELHVMHVKAEGHSPRTMSFRMKAREQRTIVLEPGPELESHLGPVRSTGIALTSLGGTSLVVAAVTGGMILAHESVADDGCARPDRTLCDGSALSSAATARDLVPWTVAAWVVGLGALGAGIPMIVFGDTEADAAAITVRSSGLSVDGRF